MAPEQREELKAAAQAADQDGQHIYTNPRDSNNWRNNDTWHAAASPAAILSLIAQVEAPTVPQGWKCVPVEVTEAMRDVYENNSVAPMGTISRYGYRAMIEAAPTIPAIPRTKEDES